MKENILNICQPGYGASCALCCGSHNYRASHEEIEVLFDYRTRFLKDYCRKYLFGKISSARSNMTGSYYNQRNELQRNVPITLTLPSMFDDCPQCPYIGYTGEERNVGCLIGLENNRPELYHECIMSYRGKIFSCQAWEILNDDEIRYAARLTGDWYYYSILIHEADLLRGLMCGHPVPEDVSSERKMIIVRELEERAFRHRELHAIHSYFD
jgi:hypothetical protein